MHLILQWTQHSVWFVGPFDSELKAVDWARQDQELRRQDSPCWHYINGIWPFQESAAGRGRGAARVHVNVMPPYDAEQIERL
jgi:hypothetical protein